MYNNTQNISAVCVLVLWWLVGVVVVIKKILVTHKTPTFILYISHKRNNILLLFHSHSFIYSFSFFLFIYLYLYNLLISRAWNVSWLIISFNYICNVNDDDGNGWITTCCIFFNLYWKEKETYTTSCNFYYLYSTTTTNR